VEDLLHVRYEGHFGAASIFFFVFNLHKYLNVFLVYFVLHAARSSGHRQVKLDLYLVKAAWKQQQVEEEERQQQQTHASLIEIELH